jgi:hypothetical protein
VSRAISESIWARIDSIAIALSINQSSPVCLVRWIPLTSYPGNLSRHSGLPTLRSLYAFCST